jgi:hypothetical protein
MWEKHGSAPIPTNLFLRRFAAHSAVATGMIAVSLGAGIAGYEYFENLALPDAFLNAAMLLGGMGPVESPQTLGGKVFAGCYALYAGVLFLAIAAVLLGPVVHRVLHRFHWDETAKRPR